MCLAIPGRIVAVDETEPGFRTARVDYGIAVKRASLLYLPEAAVGDYVIVQAGFAVTKLGEAEAQEALRAAQEIDEALGASAGPSVGSAGAPRAADSPQS